jgi:hypothetical protein
MGISPGRLHEIGRAGPPFLVQAVTFIWRPKRVLLCADLVKWGAGEERSVRFSATDPEVSYLHGSGNTFPYAQLSVTATDRWQHLEWEADLSEMKGKELSFGLMFPAAGGMWPLRRCRGARDRGVWKGCEAAAQSTTVSSPRKIHFSTSNFWRLSASAYSGFLTRLPGLFITIWIFSFGMWCLSRVKAAS